MSHALTARERLVLVASILASGIAFLDGTVVNVAIPTIQAHFGTDLPGALWVVNAYSLLEASLLLASGALSDHFGLRRILLAGILIFVGASFLCGIAGGIGWLTAFRALQGTGGAMMIPGSLALLSVSTAPERRNKAIGLWSGFGGAFGIVGPFVGGWLVEHVSWRAVFFINLPIGLAAALVLLFIAEPRKDGQRPLDLIGAALLLCGLLGLSYGLMTVPSAGWTGGPVLGSLGLGLLFFGGFVLRQARLAEPLVPLSVFADPLVAGANLATLLIYFALASTMLFVVLDLQQLQGYSPAEAGLALMPAILIISLLSGAGGSLADRLGPRLPMIAGPVLLAGGIGWLVTAGTAADYAASFLPALAVIGVAMAIIIAPLTNSALSVPEAYSGAASGLNNALASVAALLAVAVMGAVVVPIFTGALHHRLDEAPLSPAQRVAILEQAPKFGAVEIPADFAEAPAGLARAAIRGAFVDSFRSMMTVNAVLALLGAAAAAVFVHPRPRPPPALEREGPR